MLTDVWLFATPWTVACQAINLYFHFSWDSLVDYIFLAFVQVLKITHSIILHFIFKNLFILIGGQLKSRDITLLTKVHLIKAMVFPVVMYGCESRTIKKAEH